MRQLVWTITLVVLSLTAPLMFGTPLAVSVLLPGIGLSLLLAILVCDLAALAHAWQASRRMALGLPPTRPGTDYGIGPDVWWRTVPADEPYRSQDRRELAAIGSPSVAARVILDNLGVALAGSAA